MTFNNFQAEIKFDYKLMQILFRNTSLNDDRTNWLRIRDQYFDVHNVY